MCTLKGSFGRVLVDRLFGYLEQEWTKLLVDVWCVGESISMAIVIMSALMRDASSMLAMGGYI